MENPMSAAENKKLLQQIYAALACGDGKPFVDALADDFVWRVKGVSNWAGEWRGKAEVRARLFAPLFAQFDGRYANTASRVIAEDDLVVVECQGKALTKSGQRYDNTYCIIYRVRDGKLSEATEYMDTVLADRVLAPPAKAQASSSTSQ
jgi:ketosteroid isomerase-like protein